MTEQRGLFDQPKPKSQAEAKRDAALAEVLENAGPDFGDQVQYIAERERGQLVTGEDIRLYCEAAGVVPHHHNAWGAAIMRLVRRGTLVDTGRTRNMRSKKSHARKTTLYRVV